MADENTSDIPVTTEDTSNAVLGAASDLILDSTIPVPIRQNIFKALDRLGSALIDIPVGSLERRSAEKRAESEARIEITEAVNAKIVQQIKVDPEFPQRASNTFAKRILREQYNLENILGFATDILKKKKYDNSANQQTDCQTEKSIDDDWFNIFEKEASQKSSEDMQRRFGRILAGEIQKSGSYSIKAIKVLGELSENAAILFKRLCSTCVVMELPTTRSVTDMRVSLHKDEYGQNIIDIRVPSLGGNPELNELSKYGLGFQELNILNEYGLIISAYNSSLEYNVRIDNNNWFPFIPFLHQRKKWVLLSSSGQNENQRFKWIGVEFSQIGRELFNIVDQNPMPEYTNALKTFLAGQNLTMIED